MFSEGKKIRRGIIIGIPVSVIAGAVLFAIKFDFIPSGVTTGPIVVVTGDGNGPVVSGGDTNVFYGAGTSSDNYLKCIQANPDAKELAEYDDVIFYNFDGMAKFSTVLPSNLDEFASEKQKSDLFESLGRICPILDRQLKLMQDLLPYDESCAQQAGGRGVISPLVTASGIQAYEEDQHLWMKAMCKDFGVE